MADAQPSSTDEPASPQKPATADPKDRAPNALSGAARSAAGALGRAGSRLGNWLTSIGWGKFILLSMLLLVLASAIESMFGTRHPWHRRPARVPIDVNVTVDSDGLHIAAPAQGHPHPAAAAPKVQIDDKGVRIKAHGDDGRDVSVVIDHHGVRVEDATPQPAAASPQAARPPATPATPAAPATPGSASSPGQVTVPPAMISDPDKVAEAVEAAKDQIEEIVQAQIDREVAGLPSEDPRHITWPDFGELVALLLFVLMIVKIAQGSKRRAESRAQAADAVAAEEGLKRQLAEAQLKTMQAQVEPHFLFNTLASVDYLIGTDPARASRMQKNLIQYLRAAVPQMRQASSTLGQEIGLCRSYLEILRCGWRTGCSSRLRCPPACRPPPFRR